MEIDDIGARAAGDDIGTAVAVDRGRPVAAGDGVDAGRAEDRDRGGGRAGVDVGEILDRDGAGGRLIAGAGQIEADGGIEHERVGAADAAVECVFRAVIDHGVGARAADDDVAAAAAVDGGGARTAQNGVGGERADDGDRACDLGRVDIVEIGDGRRPADLTGRIGQVHIRVRVEPERVGAAGAAVDRAFRAVIIDRVDAAAADDHIRAAVAVDRLRARTARDRVRKRRALQRQRAGDAAGVDVLEVGDDRRARHLIGRIGQVHVRRRAEIDRAGSGPAIQRDFRAVVIDQIRTRAGVDDVAAAVAIDRLRARAARDRVRAGRAQNAECARGSARIDVREVLQRRRARRRLIGRIGQVQVHARVQRQRVHAARAAIQRAFRAVVIDRVRTRAAHDDICAAVAVDRVVPRAACDRVGAARTQDRDRAAHKARVHIREVRHRRAAADLIGRMRQIHARRRVKKQRADTCSAAYRRFRPVVIHEISPRPRVDDVQTTVAVNRLRTRSARDRVRKRRTENRQRGSNGAGIDIGEVRYRWRTGNLLRRMGEIDVGADEEIQRARP